MSYKGYSDSIIKAKAKELGVSGVGSTGYIVRTLEREKKEAEEKALKPITLKSTSGRTTTIRGRPGSGFKTPEEVQEIEQKIEKTQSQKPIQEEVTPKSKTTTQVSSVSPVSASSLKKQQLTNLFKSPTQMVSSLKERAVAKSQLTGDYQQPKGFLERSMRSLSEQRFKLRREEALKGENLLTGLKQYGLGVASSIVGTATSIKTIATTRPKDTIESIRKSISDFFRSPGEKLGKIGKTIRTEPEFSLGYFSAEVGTDIGLGYGLTKATKGISKISTKLSPSYKKPVAGLIKTDAGDIKLAGGVSSTAEPLKKQVSLAGKKVTAVSAQRDLFTGLKKKITVDKPLPTPDAPILEKSFFADPRARLRTSRLGLQEPAKLSDLFTGDITFKKVKPQALVFPGVDVEDLPKAIKSKLAKGQALTSTEQAKLLNLQMTPSGKFKPIGFLSKESEITLAPGEIITKQRKLGKTLISGQKVDIFQAGVKQASSKLDDLLRKGDLKGAERLLARESKGAYDFSSSLISGKKYVSPSTLLSPTISLSKGLTKISPNFEPITITGKTTRTRTRRSTSPSIGLTSSEKKSVGISKTPSKPSPISPGLKVRPQPRMRGSFPTRPSPSPISDSGSSPFPSITRSIPRYVPSKTFETPKIPRIDIKPKKKSKVQKKKEKELYNTLNPWSKVGAKETLSSFRF